MRELKQLIVEQRYLVYTLRKTGHSQTRLAQHLGVRKSTHGQGIEAQSWPPRLSLQASPEACGCHAQPLRKPYPRTNLNSRGTAARRALESPADKLLPCPEQGGGGRANHESICKHVREDKMNGSNLHTHFRCRKKHRKRYGVPKRGGHIKNCSCITKRPLVVEHLCTGDWEANTVSGSREKGKVIVTLAERKSRYCMIVASEDRKASSVSRAILEAAAPVRKRFETVLRDNAKEFVLDDEPPKGLSAKWPLAHPYHSWERRYCENTNGFIRQ